MYFAKSLAVPTGKIPIGSFISNSFILFTTLSTVPSPPAINMYLYSCPSCRASFKLHPRLIHIVLLCNHAFGEQL